MRNKKLAIVLLGISGLIWTSCNQSEIQKNDATTPSSDSLSYTVEAAPEWTSLFKRNSGWFGADGIFAVPQNGIEAPGNAAGSETYLFFSDTMIGNPEADSILVNSTMVNNTVAILQGNNPSTENIEFYWAKDDEGTPKSLFVPNTQNSKQGHYYWLGDGFVNQATGGDTYLFAYRMENTGGNWGFKEVGNTLIIIPKGSKPPFEDHKQIETPLFIPADDEQSYGSFGAGILVNTESAGVLNPDGYVYVYGVQGQDKNLLVARTRPESFEKFDSWEFWSGDNWTNSIDSVNAVTNKVSNELSVYPIAENKYALIFQVSGIGNSVGMRIGESPVGPFGPIHEIWSTKDVTSIDEDFIAYNAKAHPNLSNPGELIISYNVNSFDFFSDIEKYPHLYRPRFIRLKLTK